MLKWFQPAKKKCERLGHKMVRETYNVYTDDTQGHRGVVGAAYMTRDRCTRCNHVREEVVEVYEGITSFQAPANLWDEIRKDGYTIRNLISREKI